MQTPNPRSKKPAVPAAPPPAESEFVPLEKFWQLRAAQQGRADFCMDPRELARQEAERITAQARQEAEKIAKDAFEKGFSGGEQAGKAEGQRLYEERVRRFDQLLQELNNLRREVINRYEGELLVIIKTMLERLVNHEVSVNPRVIQACFRKSMEFVVENSVVHVHLHSEDFNRIKEASLENPALLSGKNRVQLVDDRNISQGGCLLKTDFGEVDATLEGCREKLYEAFDRAFLAALAEEKSEE